jgi:site-specific DNA-methyltransferase (adenine-specific)
MLREQIGDVEILRGDCLEWMAVLKEEGVQVDAVITDPPYGIDVDENNPFSYASKGAKKENPVEWDSSLPLDWIEPALAILYDGGNVLAFTDTRQVSDLWRYLEKVAKTQRLFYYLKNTIMPQPHPRWASCVEVGVYARKHGKARFWGGGGASPNYWIGPRAVGSDRTEHPTQKNLDLMRKLIRDLCPEGGTVLDPFGGSGTTAVAALLEGRKCITIERDEKYFEIMRKRISSWYDSDEVRQMELI